jgi:hypothetical protein
MSQFVPQPTMVKQAMAPPRTKQLAPGEAHQLLIKLRLPVDVRNMIDAMAAANGWTLQRTIVNLLGSVSHLKQVSTLAEQIEDMKITLARHGAAIVWHDLSGELLEAVDALLAADGGEERAAKERLRVVRTAMQIHQRSTRRP